MSSRLSQEKSISKSGGDVRSSFKNLSKFIRDILNNSPQTNSYQLRTLTNDLLIYWNESIKPDTEAFWIELRKNNIDFERK